MVSEINFTITVRDPNPAAAAQAILRAPAAPAPAASAVRRPIKSVMLATSQSLNLQLDQLL